MSTALDALALDRYPRSNAYDQQWIVDNLMGPHPLWSAEGLMQAMTLEPGTRVLDLGCGTALTSIFFAREYDVEVWATDLWVDPTENWQRIQDAGAADRVHPIRSDAHELPYSHHFFDAIVSIGAFNYFGTGADYLGYVTQFLRPERTNLVTVETADFLPDSWSDWLLWLKTCAEVGRGYEPDEQMLEADQGNLLGLTRLVATLN